MANEIVIIVKEENDTNLDPVKTALDSIGESAARSTEQINQGFERARDSLGRFTKQTNTTIDANGRLRDSLGRFVKMTEDGKGPLEDLGKAGEEATSLLDRAFSWVSDQIEKGWSKATDSIQSSLQDLGKNAFSGLQSALAWLITTGIPVALGAFAALAPAILAVGGAAGAATTGLAAMGIGLATLEIGFGGIGAALAAHSKAITGAGAAATNTAEQQYQAAKRIHDAERSLTDAKMNEVDAIKSVNQAIQDEITRRKELDITIQGEKASQADAAQALVEAKEAQRRADIAGSDWEKTNARNAVADAQARYDAITQKLAESTAEKAKATKVGVNGSDQVQAALKREAQAHEQVIKAEEALADAHHKTAVAAAGGAAGANLFDQAMQKLSPNAQKLVYALIALQDRFDSIKRKVQDRLLAGFDVAVTNLADKWLPHLNDILGGTADHLNKFGKGLMNALGDSTFIQNIQRAGGEGNKFIDKMSIGVDALVDAFGRLAGHSGPVLQVIGKAIEGIFVWFDKWIKKADQSGALDTFMQEAADTLQKIFDIGGKVVTVAGQFIEIIFPSSKTAGDSVLDGLNHALDQAGKWLNDPKNQKAIKQITDDIAEFIKLIVKYAIPALGYLIKVVGSVIATTVLAGKMFWNLGSTIKNAINDAWNWVTKRTASALNWLSDSASRVGNGLYSMWNGLKQGFRDALNWVIGKWNNLSFSLPFGGSIDTPNIPYMAHGGISSGGLIMAGEHGRELIRTPHGSSVVPHGQTEAMMNGGGGGAYTFSFNRTSNRLMNAIIDELRLYVKNRGGSVQVALGRAGVA